MLVRYKNKTYEVKERSLNFNEKKVCYPIRKELKKKLLTLDLGRKKIEDITEIEGLAELTNLKHLRLGGNKIKEIKGLETLTNLDLLHLGGNQIKKIKGLESLTNLKYLDLTNNQINEIAFAEKNPEETKSLSPTILYETRRHPFFLNLSS